MSQENRVICLIDDKFDTTMTIVKGLKLFSEKVLGNTENYFFLLCHVCSDKDKTEETKKYYEESMKELNTGIEKVKYLPLNLSSEKTEYYMQNPKELFGKIENYLSKEKVWTGRDGNKILYLLDMELQRGDKSKLRNKQECLSIRLYRELKLNQRKHFLYTSYNDERSILNNWMRSYKLKYGEEDVVGEEVISRADLSPQMFNAKKGMKIFGELGKD